LTVFVGPDPGPEVGDPVIVDVDGVDPAHHPTGHLLETKRGVGLTEGPGQGLPVDQVRQPHPPTPLRGDCQREPAGVLVELAEEMMDGIGVEARSGELVERLDDPDVGRVAGEDCPGGLGMPL
jgi:hypothetical protein